MSFLTEKKQFERKIRIDKIKNILKNNNNIIEKNFIIEIMSVMGVQERKAKEYLKIAKYQNGTKHGSYGLGAFIDNKPRSNKAIPHDDHTS